jgi:hypothetical protein
MKRGIMKRLACAALQAGVLALAIATATHATEQSRMSISLFKIITVKDEVLIGLNEAELQALGGTEKNAGTIARALADRKELTVWQYAVKHGENGELQEAPLRQIGVLAHDSLRVEPYSSPLAVLPHE